MESILEGQVLNDESAHETSPLPPAGHRRHRSRGGGHSRSESLVESLADIVDALQIIDEVQVDRPGHAAAAAAEDGMVSVVEGTGTDASATSTFSETASPKPKAPSRLRRQHSRTGSLVLDGILDEVLDVRDAFVEELGHADDGEKEFCFLDMNLARNITILPEDMVRVADVMAPITEEEAVVQEGSAAAKEEIIIDPEKRPLLGAEDTTVVVPPPAPTTIPLNAYVLLASAVVALSSVGPLLNVQSGINPVLKVYWRMSATAMFLFPLAASSVIHDGGIRAATQAMRGPQYFTLLVTSACYATMCVAFVLALKYTAVGNAVILSNSQSILLLIGKIFVGQRILLLEAGGALIAFCGAALCSVDSAGREGEASAGAGAGTTTNVNNHTTLMGDGLALLSAIGGVFYLTFAKAVRPNLNLYLFMFLVMFCGSTIILICMVVYTVSTADYHDPHYHDNSTKFYITIDRNIITGIWGWMNWRIDRLPLELTMVVLCNCFGAMGYIRAMQYFDNLIIAVATLLEPVIATLTAVFLGVGLLPGSLGWVGNAMVALGTFAVVYPSASSSGKGSGGGH